MDHFQGIFCKQPNLNSSIQDINDLLNLDGDTAPLQELKKRKLPVVLAKGM